MSILGVQLVWSLCARGQPTVNFLHLVCLHLQSNARIWPRTLSVDLDEELKVFDFVLWLNCYNFVLLFFFFLLLHFLRLEKNHVAPPPSQDEALSRYSVSGEVPR